MCFQNVFFFLFCFFFLAWKVLLSIASSVLETDFKYVSWFGLYSFALDSA